MGKQVTLKNIDIINAISSLVDLMEIKLPSKVSWNCSKNLRKLSSAVEDYYEFEKKLVDEYAEKDTKGEIKINEHNQWTIPQENVQIFNNKRNELFQFENTVDILPIKLSDLDKYDIKGTSLFNLEFMIDDDSE